jgi:hypothetical protein
MEDYKVTVREGLTIVEHLTSTFRMQVRQDDGSPIKTNLAMLEATLYVEHSSFVPCGSYLFSAIDNNNILRSDCADLELFKASVDFYFRSILNTELYVKSIPKYSTLYAKDESVEMEKCAKQESV